MTEAVFEICVNIIEALISVDFITRYLGCRFSGKKKYAALIICWVIAAFETTVMNYMTEFETFGAYIPIIISACYALVALQGSVPLKILIAVLTNLIPYGIALFVNLLMCNIIGYDPYELITVLNSTRVTAIVIAKLLQFYVTRIILRMKQRNPIEGRRWMMILIIPVISVISVGALMKAALIDSDISVYNLVGMICIILANIMVYWFFVEIGRDYETRMKAALLEQQNENLKNNIADNEAFVREMKTVRHDIKHQLLTILKYVEDGDCAAAKKYIDVITNNYMPNILTYIHTDNAAFDAAVNSKIAVCNQKGIFMEVAVKQGTKINLPQNEAVILFGNLLDNAIEAAEKTEAKRIMLDIRTSGSYLVIAVRNSIAKSVLTENADFKTSKKNKELHGIGMKSIRDIAERHNGMIKFYEEENEFCCHIMIDAE